MIFLDTCIWIELLGVRTPVKSHEIQQAKAASELLGNIIANNQTIVTCKEQLIELVSAIEKVMMKSVSKERKSKQLSGVGNLKDFRKLQEFQNTKRLCETVIHDVHHFATLQNIGNYEIEPLIQRLDLADINDYLYYDYCLKEHIEFYTFDSDLEKIDRNKKVHCYNAEKNIWT